MHNLKTLFWWIYEPTDERERNLYFLAYQRCNKIFFAFIMIFLTTYLLGTLGVTNYRFPISWYVVYAIIIVLIALVSSSWIFRNQDLTFQSRKNYFWTVVKNEIFFILFALLLASKPAYYAFGWLISLQTPAVDNWMTNIFGVISWAMMIFAVGCIIYTVVRKRKR